MTSDASRSPHPHTTAAAATAAAPTTTGTDATTRSGTGVDTRAATTGAGAGPRSALAALGAAFLAAPACLLAVYTAPQSARTETAWAGGAAGLALCTAVGVAAWHLFTSRRLRALLAARHAEAEATRDSALRFAEETVPALAARIRAGVPADAALAALRTDPDGPEDPVQRRVLSTLAGEVHRSETARITALAACADAARRVQTLTAGLAVDLRELEHRHDDAALLGDLLRLDHGIAQTGRLADTVAVLSGAQSVRRWPKPVPMETLVRGAMGRIQDYQRVRLHSTSGAAVDGDAAEGVMHALAELLDNAARYSPSASEVHVYAEEVATGVVITVEDGGRMMDGATLRRAEEAVGSRRHARVPDTGGGTQLGLAVVGRLAHRYGLTVSFRPSAHGGTGVLLRIPLVLLAARPEHRPPGRPAELAHRAGAAELAELTELESAPEVPLGRRAAGEPQPEHGAAVLRQAGNGGLPQRRAWPAARPVPPGPVPAGPGSTGPGSTGPVPAEPVPAPAPEAFRRTAREPAHQPDPGRPAHPDRTGSAQTGSRPEDAAE